MANRLKFVLYDEEGTIVQIVESDTEEDVAIYHDDAEPLSALPVPLEWQYEGEHVEFTGAAPRVSARPERPDLYARQKARTERSKEEKAKRDKLKNTLPETPATPDTPENPETENPL